jgi:hypothetical protein
MSSFPPVLVCVGRQYLKTCLKGGQRHLKTIQRYGRYPHRNELLGRTSTAEVRGIIIISSSSMISSSSSSSSSSSRIVVLMVIIIIIIIIIITISTTTIITLITTPSPCPPQELEYLSTTKSGFVHSVKKHAVGDDDEDDDHEATATTDHEGGAADGHGGRAGHAEEKKGESPRTDGDSADDATDPG